MTEAPVETNAGTTVCPSAPAPPVIRTTFPFSSEKIDQIKAVVLKAYRWQYIISGIEQPRFMKILRGMITEAQGHRINEALAPIL